MKRDKWNALPECNKCKVLMKKKTFPMAGFKVRG